MRRPRRIPLPNLARRAQAKSAIALYIPTDEPTSEVWHRSFKGALSLRISGMTGGYAWSVDTYNGDFYRVEVVGDGQVCHSIPEMIGYLRFRLHLQPGD